MLERLDKLFIELYLFKQEEAQFSTIKYCFQDSFVLSHIKRYVVYELRKTLDNSIGVCDNCNCLTNEWFIRKRINLSYNYSFIVCTCEGCAKDILLEEYKKEEEYLLGTFLFFKDIPWLRQLKKNCGTTIEMESTIIEMQYMLGKENRALSDIFPTSSCIKMNGLPIGSK